MKFFVDTADTAEIKSLAASGLLDGVTTNPSLMAKTGKAIPGCAVRHLLGRPRPGQRGGRRHRIRRHDGGGPRVARDRQEHHGQGAADAGRAARLPPPDRRWRYGQRNAVFLAAQAILAAKAGATFVSPFIGRLDDVGEHGMGLIADIVTIFRNYPLFRTEVLVASVRNPTHVVEAAKLGAHVTTMPPAILRQLFNHPLTEKGLAAFLADWAKTGQQIA